MYSATIQLAKFFLFNYNLDRETQILISKKTAHTSWPLANGKPVSTAWGSACHSSAPACYQINKIIIEGVIPLIHGGLSVLLGEYLYTRGERN